ncbi:MAG: OprD family outer membrane porin [Acidithiobacillus sp.]|jgi:hypothetical protein|nr:OprD family outer membrane porin [Acidithiobacillus sp.]
MKKTRFAIGTVAMALALAGTVAQAETLSQFFAASKIDGQIRSDYFSRLFGDPNVPNANFFGLAGILNIKTAPFLGGFGVGVSFYTANDLGVNNLNGAPAYPYTDLTLMGPRQSINALGQAYLQYAIPKRLLVRVGNQVINTPWMNASDSRILPATYQGVFAKVTPIKDLNLYGMRIFRWKSRTSADYYKDNLYYPATFSGDNLYGDGYGGSIGGAFGNIPSTAPQTSGALAFGSSYALMGAKVQLWYYDFYQFANMFYGDANYTLKTGTGFNPFVGGQFVREYDSHSLLGNVNATAYGLIGGVHYQTGIGAGTLSFAYNAINPHGAAAYGHGAIVSPYTIGYATDPLYTTSMIRGLVETGPGNAWKVKVAQHFNKEFLLLAAFAEYHTYYFGNSNDAYLDLTYFPGADFKDLKGLSIRDRVEISNGGIGLNPGNQSFIYNRVMLTYLF